MKIILINILFSFILIACRTNYQYKSQLMTLVGQPEEVLIAKWGKPTGRYTDENGNEIITYIYSRDIIVPSTPSYTIYSGGGFSNVMTGRAPIILQSTQVGMVGGIMHLSCMTKFIVKNGIVNSSTFKGNDCKSKN